MTGYPFFGQLEDQYHLRELCCECDLPDPALELIHGFVVRYDLLDSLHFLSEYNQDPLTASYLPPQCQFELNHVQLHAGQKNIYPQIQLLNLN